MDNTRFFLITKVRTQWKALNFDHRDILIEVISSQKVCATSLSTGDQGGAPTLSQWPQCYKVWNEIDIFKICDKNINYALKHYYNIQ